MTEANLRATYLDPGTLDQLGSMQVRVAALVEGILAGMHRSPHRGGSIEFAEYKEYSPGHEIRHIDWKVFAKSDKYYVKQFQDETNLRVYMVMDGSGSMRFKSEDAPISKLKYVSYLAASFAWILLRQGDAVGALSVEGERVKFLKASSKSTHLDDLFYLFDDLPARGRTSLMRALKSIAERARARSLVMIYSDMLDADEDLMQMLRVLRKRRYEVVIFHVVDPAEWALPYEGLTQFIGMEDEGEIVAEADDLREEYQKVLQEHFHMIERNVAQGNIGYYRFDTTDPIEAIALSFLRGRG